jgi:hypothetical protein
MLVNTLYAFSRVLSKSSFLGALLLLQNSCNVASDGCQKLVGHFQDVDHHL